MLKKSFPTIEDVKQDIVHWMDRYKVPLKHPLTKLFKCGLSDCIFIRCSGDVEEFKKKLREAGLSEEEIAKIPSYYFNCNGRARRYVPSGEIVIANIDKLLDLFKSYDPTFVSKELLECHRKNKKHGNCIADHPSVNYYRVRKDGKLQTCRGTPKNETIHSILEINFAASSCSIILRDLSMMDIIFQYNIDRMIDCKNIMIILLFTLGNLIPDLKSYDAIMLFQLQRHFSVANRRFLDHDPIMGLDLNFNLIETLEQFGCRSNVGSIEEIDQDSDSNSEVNEDSTENEPERTDTNFDDMVESFQNVILDDDETN